jgi:hypothetical protein
MFANRKNCSHDSFSCCFDPNRREPIRRRASRHTLASTGTAALFAATEAACLSSRAPLPVARSVRSIAMILAEILELVRLSPGIAVPSEVCLEARRR